MTFSQRVVSITQDTILPKIVYNILTDNFITYRIVGAGKKWTGETLKKPIKIVKSTLGGSFSGLDTHSTSTVESRITLSYDLRGYEMPVSVPGMERAVNATESQVINLVRAELESAQQDALDDLGDIFYGDGTGNSSKDFNGLGNLDDDGTTASTVGNQSRTTYSSLNGTRTASGGTLTLTKISTLLTAVSAGSAPRQRPTILISNETVWDLGESLLHATVRANYAANGFPMVTRNSKGVMSEGALKGAQGFVSIVYRGVPWVADEKSTAQTLWAVNENYLEWYGLKDSELESISLGMSTHEGVYDDAPSANTGFQWTGFMKPINQYGVVGHIYLLGNLTTFQPRRHGRLTGITGV